MASIHRAPKSTARRQADDGHDSAPAAPIDREEQIRLAAYFLYENNGQRLGHELDDWIAAEAQLGLRPNVHAGPSESKAAD